MHSTVPLGETHARYRKDNLKNYSGLCLNSLDSSDFLSSKGSILYNLRPILITHFLKADFLQFSRSKSFLPLVLHSHKSLYFQK